MDVGGLWVHRSDARSLQPGRWLTDGIINAAVRLWLHRPRADMVALSTFLMSTLCSTMGTNNEYTYSKVVRWVDRWTVGLLIISGSWSQ